MVDPSGLLVDYLILPRLLLISPAGPGLYSTPNTSVLDQHIDKMVKSALYTLLTLFSASRLSSALQVTPNSPCSSVCRDSTDLDTSDPNSSTTKNSDITCKDADYSGPAGTKFKSCMTCLQTSTFSQGSESDTMWFLCTSPRFTYPQTSTYSRIRQPEVHGCILCFWIPQRDQVDTMHHEHRMRQASSRHRARSPGPQRYNRLLLLHGWGWGRHGLFQLRHLHPLYFCRGNDRVFGKL